MDGPARLLQSGERDKGLVISEVSSWTTAQAGWGSNPESEFADRQKCHDTTSVRAGWSVDYRLPPTRQLFLTAAASPTLQIPLNLPSSDGFGVITAYLTISDLKLYLSRLI